MPISNRDLPHALTDRSRGVVRRWNWWTDAVGPIAVFAFAWWLGWGPYIAVGAAAAAGIITAVVRPRRPGRWTE